MKKIGWRAIAAIGAAACGASQARATGFELREQSAVGQGSSFAGVAARADDPSMIFFNPAAMSGLGGVQAVVVGNGIFPNVSAASATATRINGTPITGSAGGDIGLSAFVPAGYATVQLAPNWHFGLGVNSPWGLVTKNADDAVSRYHALTSSLKVIDLTPAISWQVAPTVSLGAAMIIQNATARLSSAVDFGMIGAASGLPFRPGSADGRSTIRGDSTDLGWQIGGQWQPYAGTRIGIAYRSQILHRLNGDASFQGVPFPLSQSSLFANTGATAKLTTPATATLGISQALGERWTLLGGMQWTNWSSFKTLTVNFDSGRPPSITAENWKDSLFFSVGGEYAWNEKLTLRGGLAYDQTPTVTGDRTPRIPDNNRYWLSIGASYAVTQKLILSAGYTHIFAANSNVSLADPGPANSNLFRGNLNASYKLSADVISAQARLIF